MKKIVFLSICTVSLFGLVSCGSTAPCGLAKTKEVKQLNIEQHDDLVADTE